MSRRQTSWGAFVLLAVSGAALLSFSGCGGAANEGATASNAAAAPAAPAAPSAPAAPQVIAAPASQPATAPDGMQLAAIAPLALDAGASAKVALAIDRRGVEGPLAVAVTGAPEGVTATSAEIPADQSAGNIDVAAGQSLAATGASGTLQVTITANGGANGVTQTVPLVVNKVNIPVFSAPADIVVQPGAKASAPLTITRNGFEGAIEPKLETPDGGTAPTVKVEIEPIAAGASETQLEIAADAKVPEGVQTLRVVATVNLERGPSTIALDVPVKVVQKPFSLDSFRVVTLKPGETKKIDIPVLRTAWSGPIHLSLDGLPNKVTAPPIDLAGEQTSAGFTLTAAKDANSMVRTVKIISTAGYLTRTDNLIVRVLGTGEGFLPREVTDNKDLFRLLRRGSFGGRLTSKSKQALLDAYGGTQESEDAVARGLKWLAKHQQVDGSWPLKHYDADVFLCDCCTSFEDDVVDMDNAGTALGVLPFLGAGITPKQAPDDRPEYAKYRKNVEKALDWLIDKQQKNGNLGGSFYGHALGVMALCEAYALTGDEKMKMACQMAVKYMLDGQHDGGGWRYGPKQEGDISATGWIFLAIRTAQLSGVTIGKTYLEKAEKFIDSCGDGPSQVEQSRYGYQKGTAATLPLTSVGLLTREYLGWKADDPNLVAGCKYLMENLPPDSGDALGPMYYYYYATQVLHHVEGQDFDLWNLRMREHLLRTQARSGHEEGSWRPEGVDWGKQGGRIYSTSLALLTLQVYYRHLPLYRRVK